MMRSTVILLFCLVAPAFADDDAKQFNVRCEERSEVVTDVKEKSDGVAGCIYYGSNFGCLVAGCAGTKPVPATWREITTTVKRVRTLKFSWLGKAWETKDEEVLSTKTVRLVKKDEWVEATTR